MIDRSLLTDVALALLIALPSALPAAPGPWSADDEGGKTESPAVESPANAGEWAHALAAAPQDLPG